MAALNSRYFKSLGQNLRKFDRRSLVQIMYTPLASRFLWLLFIIDDAYSGYFKSGINRQLSSPNVVQDPQKLTHNTFHIPSIKFYQIF